MLLFAMLLAQEGQKAPEAAPAWTSFMLPVMLVLIGYFVLFRPMRQQQRQQQMLLSTLKKNDEVLTSAGIYGIVVSVKEKEDEVALKIDDSSPVRLRVSKGSIVRILNREPAKEQDKEKEEKKKDEE